MHGIRTRDSIKHYATEEALEAGRIREEPNNQLSVTDPVSIILIDDVTAGWSGAARVYSVLYCMRGQWGRCMSWDDVGGSMLIEAINGAARQVSKRADLHSSIICVLSLNLHQNPAVHVFVLPPLDVYVFYPVSYG